MVHLCRILIVLVGIVVLDRLVEGGFCTYYSQCQKVGYKSQKYYKKCGAFGWKRCGRYRKQKYTYTQACKHSRCCSGYVGSSCSQAVCHGSTTCPNRGTCTRPNYCSCRSGFASPRCADINECSSRNGGCNHRCTNSHGSFRCSCNKGYTLQRNKKTCVDINECSSHNGGCNQICRNSAGSYRCYCRTGYSLGSNKKTCSDINECLVKNGGCSHTCKNTAGSFTCHCRSGFTLQSDHKTCSDTNECKHNNGGCQQLCVNEHASFHCECKSGYQLQKDGKSCSDINECHGNSRCSHICHNTVGSYKCSCRPGYQLGSDGTSCQDIDDCIGVNCLNGGSCIDHTQSYTCKCAPGFEGRHCETDINECQFVNGGCHDTCINTAGSYHCQCNDGGVLDSNGFACIGNNTSKGEPTVFESHRIARHHLPRGCAFIELTTCDGSSSSQKILLSSTSDWFRLNTNSSVMYTYGVVFIEVNRLSLPISLSGMEVVSSTNGFEMLIGSLRHSEQNGALLHHVHNYDCMSFKLSPKDIQDFITSGSFLLTFFDKLQDKLPDWLRFSKSGTGLLAVTDLKTDLIRGNNMNTIQECRDAPVHTDRLYNVFRFGTELSVSIYGNQIRLPAPVRGNKFCVIVDFCQDSGGTVFFMLPPESRNMLDNFSFFKSYADNFGLRFRPHGVGLSLNKGINVRYKSQTIRLWNGDHFSQYSVFPSASVWLNTDIEMSYIPKDWLSVNITGNSEIFISVPDISKLLTGVFVDEWNGLIKFNNFKATPRLQFRMFKKDVVIEFRDMVTASLEAYFSLGGSSDRIWCGNGANPEGVFVSFLVGVNPFRHVPIIKDWLLNMNVRIHAFLSTDPYSEPSINVLTDIIDLKKLVRTFVDLIDNVINRVGDKLKNSTISLLHDFRNITLSFENKLKDIKGNGDSLPNIVTIVTSTWKMYVREVKETGQELKDALEFEKDIISKNISEIIDNEHAEIGRNINKIISKVKDQVFSVVKRYTGFGLKFAVTSMQIGGLEITWLDVELVHSVNQLGQCSKFKKVYDLLKGEKSVKLLARSTIKQRLGYFIKVEVSGSFSIAFSIESFKFVTHVHAHVSVLGIKIATDVLLSNHQLYFSIEGNIWNVFLARIEFSAKTGKNWDALEFIAKGQLLSRSTDPKSDFQGSYLDGLRMLARKTSENANKRFQAVQDKLSSAQKVLDHAKDKLTSAQEKIRGANGAFDSAVRALGRVKQKLERAKGPFERAMEKLRRAQRKVDNLCRIRTCHKICVPGFKVKTCKKGWVKYPCLRRSGCMFRVPNLACELANVACRGVRGLAYVVLEAAKLFVRLPILALDAAKALVSGAQLVVDKSRVVLKLAEGILEVAKLGLDVVKGTIEIAKIAVKGVKFIVGAALHVFELIIKYGLQSILDVKNCRFEIQLTTSDKLAFEVSCEVNAFRTGWHTFEFEFDFRHPLNSMWRMAKSTISSLLSIVKSILHLRKRRDISHAPTSNVDWFFPPTLKNTSSAFENNKTSPNINNTIFMENIETDRVRFFASTCGAFQNIYLLLSESIDTLLSITNESVSTLNDVTSIKGMLVEMESNMTTDNMTAENLGISPEYALQDYNITADELQSVIQNINISADPFLAEIVATTTFARGLIDEQMANVDDVSIIESWLLSMENITGNYFNESECIGFEDCVYYAFNVLDDLFYDDTMQNSQINRNLTSHIKSSFQTLVQNISLSILDSYNISTEIQMYLHRLNKSNVFCSEPPAIITDLNNQTVRLGSDIRFICNASGNPTPTIRWYHNDTLIIGQDGAELVLVNATKINEGVYQCVAENIVTNATSNEAFVEIKDVEVTKPTSRICYHIWGYHPNPYDCAGFIQCFWGMPIPMPCSRGTIWSQQFLTCVFGTC